MLVSAVSEGDERRAIDTIMTKLRSLVEETGAGIVLVSHLRRVDGNKGHENGVEVSLSHLRGSNSIGQLSDCVIALERNQQSDDIDEARTTRVRVLKSRYTGDVGLATHLLYDGETGRLSEIDTSDIKVDLNEGLEISGGEAIYFDEDTFKLIFLTKKKGLEWLDPHLAKFIFKKAGNILLDFEVEQ